MNVGFIGLGNMGRGMAANLVKAGHNVTVYNRTPGKDEELIYVGAKSATKVADACRFEAIFTMLADDHAVESVVYGDQGMLESLGKGAIHVSSSTISVSLSERLTAAHAAAGQRFVAAPVFGRPEAAAEESSSSLPLVSPRRSVPQPRSSTPSDRRLSSSPRRPSPPIS